MNEVNDHGLLNLRGATAGDSTKEAASSNLNQAKEAYPAWECSSGVCVLEWKPRQEKKRS